MPPKETGPRLFLPNGRMLTQAEQEAGERTAKKEALINTAAIAPPVPEWFKIAPSM